MNRVRKVEVNEERKKIISAYKQLFNSPNGKVVLEDLEQSFGGNTFDDNANKSFYKQGQRSVLLAIKNAIEE